MDNTHIENPEQDPKLPDQIEGQEDVLPSGSKQTPPTGRRHALRNVRRQLTDEELAQSGTQKMLLDMLEEAENEKENLKSYVTSFHESDKKAAILGEKLNADRSIEVFFGVGVGMGGTILGLAPFLWDKGVIYGLISLFIGVCLIIGASIGRAIKK